jgi:predicted ATPase
MRLRSVKITGYKRFARSQLLYLGPRIVAIVGPNEAGKTSLLRALSHLPADATFNRREFTGRQQPAARTTVISARYEVEDGDRNGISHLFDRQQDYIFTYSLQSTGAMSWTLEPAITRDTTSREYISKSIADINDSGALVIPVISEDETASDLSLSSMAEALAAMLSEAEEDLTLEQLDQIATLRQHLDTNGDRCADSDAARALLQKVSDLQLAEREENPRIQIFHTLFPRLPQMLVFDDQQRTLRSDYTWVEITKPPPALDNLLHLAGISFEDYRTLAIDRERREDLSTVERAINRQLGGRLLVWSQNQLTVTLRADHESLAIYVTDQDTDRDVLLEERSAGLRMFASLLAFCARYAGNVPPILLFDEAETHLHYGAQADLMNVFARQNIAQAVIYTTHSIGCLPEDLGCSIRVVAPIGKEESEIRNEFWSGGAGLTPLMLAMGASAVAFSPARYVLLGEGPTEAILLPSLFRAACHGKLQDRALGFQVASGTAEIPSDLAPDLEKEAGSVAYLFDADTGGREHAAKLSARANEEERVLILGDGNEPNLCTEDLVDVQTYTAAVNEVLSDTRNTTDELTTDELPAVWRPHYVDDWCRVRGMAPLSKVRIAERILRIAEHTGTLTESSREALLAELYQKLCRVFGLA